jgi:hypothetical protein
MGGVSTCALRFGSCGARAFFPPVWSSNKNARKMMMNRSELPYVTGRICEPS